MNSNADEFLDLASRYVAETGVTLSSSDVVGYAQFAQWVLSQKLQQADVSGSLPPMVRFKEFLKTEVEMKFLKKADVDRITWYIDTYFLE